VALFKTEWWLSNSGQVAQSVPDYSPQPLERSWALTSIAVEISHNLHSSKEDKFMENPYEHQTKE